MSKVKNEFYLLNEGQGINLPYCVNCTEKEVGLKRLNEFKDDYYTDKNISKFLEINPDKKHYKMYCCKCHRLLFIGD